MTLRGLGPLAIRSLLRPNTKRVWGVDIRYHVGDTIYTLGADRQALRATLSESRGEADTEIGITLEEQVKVFKIDAADLPVEPRHSDLIEWIDAGRWFKVLVDGGQASVEDNDHHRTTWQLHTKEVPAPEVGQNIYGASTGEAYGTPDDTAYVPPAE